MRRRHSSAGHLDLAVPTSTSAHCDQFGMAPWGSGELAAGVKTASQQPPVGPISPENIGSLAPTPNRAAAHGFPTFAPLIASPQGRPEQINGDVNGPLSQDQGAPARDPFGQAPFEVVVCEGNARPRPRPSSMQRRHTVAGSRMKRHVVLSPAETGGASTAFVIDQTTGNDWLRASPTTANRSAVNGDPSRTSVAQRQQNQQPGELLVQPAVSAHTTAGEETLELAPTNPFARDVQAMSTSARSLNSVEQNGSVVVGSGLTSSAETSLQPPGVGETASDGVASPRSTDDHNGENAADEPPSNSFVRSGKP